MSNYAFEGVSQWIIAQLRPLLALSHLVRDSEQFKKQLSGLHVADTDKFYTLDVKDFFISGCAEALITDCTES